MRVFACLCVMILALLGLLGCGSLAFWQQDNSDAEAESASTDIPLADMTYDENGDVLAVVGDGDQMIAVSGDSDIAGTSIMVAAGALAIGTEIQVASGSSLATATIQSELGMTGSMEQVSATVNIVASQDVALLAPLTVAISLSSATSLNLAEETQFAILCKMKKPGEESYSLEVWGQEKFTLNGDRVEFETLFFGSYQVIKLAKDITLPEPKTVTSPILSQAQEKALDPLTIKVTATKDATASSVVVKYSLQGDGSIEKCMLFPDIDGKLPFELKAIDMGTKVSSTYTAIKKESLFFAVGCRDKNGREIALVWTPKVSLEAPASTVPVIVQPKSEIYCDAGAGDTCSQDSTDPYHWFVATASPSYLFYFTIQGLVANDYYRIRTVTAADSCNFINGDPWVTFINNPNYNPNIYVSNITATAQIFYICIEGKKADNTQVMADKLTISITGGP